MVTGGTATGGGVDYTLAAGTLTFDPGVTSDDVVISIVDDGDGESDETIEVTLSSPTGATLGINTIHTYTINDNDEAPPIAHWDLDDGSGTTATDITGGGNDGVLVGGPTWVTGHIGQALSFDGIDDSVDVDNFNIPMSMDAPKSMSAWMYIYTTYQSYNWCVVSFSDDNKKAEVRMKADGKVQAYGGAELVAANNQPPANDWVHMCYTFDGTTHRIYVNGVDEGSSTTANDVGNCDMFRIGRVARFGQNPMDGMIDDVRVYDRELTPTEVQDLYNGN